MLIGGADEPFGPAEARGPDIRGKTRFERNPGLCRREPLDPVRLASARRTAAAATTRALSERMRITPQRLDRNGRSKPRTPRTRLGRNLRMREVGQCVAFDTIVRFINTTRRCLFTATDHASEFAGAFHPYPAAQGWRHCHTYPRCPKINAHAERFNRTVQEEFVDYHEDLLRDDPHTFNHRLLDYPQRYNSERPHLALNCLTPRQAITEKNPDLSRMWWHHTCG